MQPSATLTFAKTVGTLWTSRDEVSEKNTPFKNESAPVAKTGVRLYHLNPHCLGYSRCNRLHRDF